MAYRFLNISSKCSQRINLNSNIYKHTHTKSQTYEPKDTNSETRFDLSFKEYRSIRKRMKWRDLGVGLLGGVVSMYGFIEVFTKWQPGLFTMAPEDIKPILGLDPLIVLGMGGMSSLLIGYLALYHGGAVVWRLFRPQLANQLSGRDKDFLNRIAKYRFKGVTNQSWEDDYHGERINTLSDYRQWIRKQQQKKRAADLI